MARLISSKLQEEEQNLDIALRPKTLEEFIGQERIKENLKISMEAAKKREEPLDHVLIYGCPGLGKTSLAHIIAREMETKIRITSGPAIERTGDLAAILTNLENGDILFIDECHRLNKIIEEILYPAMEEYHLDIIIGKGPQARTLRLDLPRFTLIGATTRISLISSPLRDRFGNIYHLNFYQLEDIEKILKRSSNILKIKIEEKATKEIANRARQTPRVANRLLKRVRDYAQVKSDGLVTRNLAWGALEQLEIDEKGLDHVDRNLLKVIIEKFGGGPVGVGSLSATTSEERETIEEIYEPYLMQLGFLARTPRGRVATKAAYEHLGLEVPREWQEKLV